MGLGTRKAARDGGGRGGGGVGQCLGIRLFAFGGASRPLSPPLILTLPELPDDLSCLTSPGVGRPGDGLLPAPLTIQAHTPSPCGGLPTPALACAGVCICRRAGGGGGFRRKHKVPQVCGQ